MPFEAFLLVLVLIVVIVLLGIRLLKAQAEMALLTEAKDALAGEFSRLTVENKRLELENAEWAAGARGSRRTIRPAQIFPEEA